MVRLLRLLIIAAGFAVAGCYHMRVDPVPLPKGAFVVQMPLKDAYFRVATMLRADGFSVEATEGRDDLLTTGFRYFYTQTGFGQPTEGRNYHYRLRVNLKPEGAGTRVGIEPEELELRSTYIFSQEGHLQTFSKVYPYEQYPGMFDLTVVEKELARVERLLDQVAP